MATLRVKVGRPEFLVEGKDKPGTWRIIPLKLLTAGEWGFYAHVTRGFSADIITAVLLASTSSSPTCYPQIVKYSEK
jgi:hypothetical protein